MSTRKGICLAAVSLGALTLTASPAWADHPYWTDGTESYEGDHWGAPPNIEWDEDGCRFLVDPTSYVQVTLHATIDGAEVHDVQPYLPTTEGEVGNAEFPGANLGLDEPGPHQITAFATWNIGPGRSPVFEGEVTCVELPATTTTVCTEDMPCWDCETMGNRICGDAPVAVPEDEHFVELAPPVTAEAPQPAPAAPVASVPEAVVPDTVPDTLPETGLSAVLAAWGIMLCAVGGALLWLVRR